MASVWGKTPVSVLEKTIFKHCMHLDSWHRRRIQDEVPGTVVGSLSAEDRALLAHLRPEDISFTRVPRFFAYIGVQEWEARQKHKEMCLAFESKLSSLRRYFR